MNDVHPEQRTRRSAAALIPTTVAVVLSTLAIAGVDLPREGAGVVPPSAATVTSTAIRSSADPGSASGSGVPIVLELPRGTATATLEDTPTARQVAAMLPLELTLRDPMGQAKAGPLPVPLAVIGAPRVLDPELAGIYYWAPSADLAIYYDDLDQTVPPPGLVRLGTLTGGLPALAAAGNRFTATVTRAGDHRP